MTFTKCLPYDYAMVKLAATTVKNVLNTILNGIAACKDDFVVCSGVDFTRNRACPFETTMRIILGMHGGSLRKELIDLFPDINDRITASALVQQRGKIKPDAFIKAFNEFNHATAHYDSLNHMGYHLFAVDGSAINIAKNPDSDTYFQQGFNQIHLVALYDICNKTYRDAVIQPRPKMNENAALKCMVRRTKLPEKSIIICDRLFGQYSIYETIRRTGADYLVRVSNSYSKETRELPMEELDIDKTIELRTTQTKQDKADFKAGKAKYITGLSKFGKDKRNVTWEYESPFQLNMRIVRFQLVSGEYETIVTSLNRFEFPIEEIKRLYSMRWGIETSFRELKYDVGLTHLHARKEDCVIQEIYAHMLMYNFSMRIAMHVGLTKSCGKYNYKVNFANAFYICRRFFWGVISNVEAEISSQLLPIRPGRTDKRKLLPKTFVSFAYRVA